MKPVFRTLSLLFICAVLVGLFASIGPAAFDAAAAQPAAGATANVAGPAKAAPGKAASTGTQLATSELLRVEQEIQALNQRLAELSQEENSARGAADIVRRAAPLRAGARDICAPGSDEAAKVLLHANVVAILQEAGAIASSRPGPWQAPLPATWQELCQAGPAEILAEVEAQLSAMGSAAAQRPALEQQLAALGERRDEVVREMTDDLAGNSVANNIPWLMLIIFGVGGVTLAGVKIFSEDVQRELIASGQIVQFVTILILLGVILALGLAQRLAAETLGTLLGGLAGYVLSQGVGRQAQQQVLNEIKSAAVTAPPSPPPAPPQG
jgi:hypothetical protein